MVFTTRSVVMSIFTILEESTSSVFFPSCSRQPTYRLFPAAARYDGSLDTSIAEVTFPVSRSTTETVLENRLAT